MKLLLTLLPTEEEQRSWQLQKKPLEPASVGGIGFACACDKPVD